MYCNKCGSFLPINSNYCNKCGNSINYNKNSTKKPIQLIIVLASFAVLLLLIFLINYFKSGYYFSNKTYDNNTENNTNENKSKYSTVIITDNTYSGVSISNTTDAKNLIVKDSLDQKTNCPQSIQTIENDIVSKYGISAVNLCEIDTDFAKEIENAVETIYNEFPEIKSILTNLSIINTSLNNDYIAAFYPMFIFAKSNTTSTYPWVIKTQIFLNSTYFLNKSRLEVSIKSSSEAGHFPPNATIYSPVAHELGHYLSYIALIKSYTMKETLLINSTNIDKLYTIYSDFALGTFSKGIIEEAYKNYNKTHTDNLSIDEWRGTISLYALAKDNDGNYIYDETIAEAFHDVYLNKLSAKEASKYIIAVLKERLRD